MNVLLYIIIGIMAVAGGWWFIRHQRKLRLRAHLMQEAIRNCDFTFRMPTHGLLPGERAMQETLNQLGETIRQQVWLTTGRCLNWRNRRWAMSLCER